MTKKQEIKTAPSGEVNETKVAADMSADQLAREKSKVDAPDVPPPNPSALMKTRKPREQYQHYLEKMAVSGMDNDVHSGEGVAVGAYETNRAIAVADVDAAMKHIRDNNLDGDFRVIAVKKVLKVTKEQKTVLKFE